MQQFDTKLFFEELLLKQIEWGVQNGPIKFHIHNFRKALEFYLSMLFSCEYP